MAVAYVFEDNRLKPLDWQPRRFLRWASWRPDGTAALLVGNGGSAQLFDGRRLDAIEPVSRQNLRGAAWSTDGEMALLVGNRGAVLSLEGESMIEVPSPTVENLRRVAWHPDGAYALIVGNAGVVLRYERGNGSLIPLPADRAHTLRSVAFQPDGAYALIGAYASRHAGYPRTHALYRCDGRYVQGLLATDDEDDIVTVDWSSSGLAMSCGYAWRPDGTMINKALLYDGSSWRTISWPATAGVVLGAAWRPGSEEGLLVGENGSMLRMIGGELESIQSETTDNFIGPFWRPDGSSALILKGPNEKVYTV